MLEALQLATAVAGFFSVALATYIGARFYRSRHELGHALGIQLFGEATVGMLVIGFATATHLGFRWSDHPVAEMAMRWGIFGVASVTSVHLFRRLRQLTR